MALPSENVSMALYCDFENVALGVRDAKYDKFDIRPVLERLLLKGSIVVKKAYCDWDRYKEFKPQMHEASFELIEIPHVRQSGKNSADIRLVVDALDLCYTKSHVNTFVIISGDSDFSPLVSKLRENAKYVIGVGVKNSTSDLLVGNCDDFIFIDDLVRESKRQAAKAPRPQPRTSPAEELRRKDDPEARKSRAIEMALETFEALLAERGDSGKIWASALKQAIKRRRPDFNESFYGFRTFGNLLEEAQARGLLEVGRDDKSGAYVYRNAASVKGGEVVALAPAAATQSLPEAEKQQAAMPAEDEEVVPQTPPAAPAEIEGDRVEGAAGVTAGLPLPAEGRPKARSARGTSRARNGAVREQRNGAQSVPEPAQAEPAPIAPSEAQAKGRRSGTRTAAKRARTATESAPGETSASTPNELIAEQSVPAPKSSTRSSRSRKAKASPPSE